MPLIETPSKSIRIAAVPILTDLFDDDGNLGHQFPEPQYLGAKYRLLPWIGQYIPRGVSNVLDAFSGSQSVSYFFKQKGLKVIANDFLNFSNQIGKALIENNSIRLNGGDVAALFGKAKNKADYCLMETLFAGLFFEKEEARFIDNFRANVESLNDPYKRALALAVMNRSLTRKVTMGHFAHTQALAYANDPARIKRNRSLARSVKDIFLDLLPLYNAAVFDNGRKNKSYSSNVLSLLPALPNVDLAYFDPPYCGSHADYQSFYHLLETYTEYWKDKQFVNGTRRYEPARYSGFDKRSEVIASFEKLFALSEKIPYWLVSYNNRSFPKIDDFKSLISKYKDVTVQSKTYQNGRGGKGSIAGSDEILFVCKPKAH